MLRKNVFTHCWLETHIADQRHTLTRDNMSGKPRFSFSFLISCFLLSHRVYARVGVYVCICRGLCVYARVRDTTPYILSTHSLTHTHTRIYLLYFTTIKIMIISNMTRCLLNFKFFIKYNFSK